MTLQEKLKHIKKQFDRLQVSNISIAFGSLSFAELNELREYYKVTKEPFGYWSIAKYKETSTIIK